MACTDIEGEEVIMIALIMGLLVPIFLLYIKYRFHIQFGMLVAKGVKFLNNQQKGKNNGSQDARRTNLSD